jgi:hypothetical protein
LHVGVTGRSDHQLCPMRRTHSRRSGPIKPLESLPGYDPEDDWGPSSDDDEEDDPFLEWKRKQTREPRTPDQPADPRIWRSATRMTQTEAALRLGIFLLRADISVADVHVALRGREVTRAGAGAFPVEAFLADHGTTRPEHDTDWRGTYTLERCKYALVVHSDADAPHVMTELARECRLLVEVAGGSVVRTRSPAEHRALWNAIGRLLTRDDVQEMDTLAVAVPRSPRFRKLVRRARNAPAVKRVGMHIYTVDRGGGVDVTPLMRPISEDALKTANRQDQLQDEATGY